MEIKYGRKRSGIKRQLKQKLDDWILSIDNEEVQKAIKKDAIITGGSIASMLMGDPVNDYDIYMRTKESTKLVAEYYVKEFNKAIQLKNNTPSDVAPYVKELTITNIKGEQENVVQIHIQSAGVASEEQSTYQYFEQKTEDELIEFSESLINKASETKPKYRPVFMSQNAITLSDKVQIVIRFYGEPSEIHRNYDFEHAKCYYDYAENNLATSVEALEAMMSRTLIYSGSLYPIASVFRTKKFLERGWRITAGQLLKMAWQISEINLKDENILREQLTGVDMAYMWQLIEALKSVEPEKINSTYVAEIIDRIFD